MKRPLYPVIVLLVVLTACAPTATPLATPTLQVVSVYASPATEPWLDEVYTCAEQASVVILLSAAESTADLRLRWGEPEHLILPAYQIGSDDLLVVTNRESPLQNLTRDEVRSLFSQGQEAIQIWVFASGAEVQEVFEREIMFGSSIHSLARLAAHPQIMSDILNAEKNAVGILPRRWKAGSVRGVFTLANIPVLAITSAEPHNSVQKIIACLQQ